MTDYAASVEALANKQVDMAWFGGFTFVQANVRSNGQVIPLIQRAEDEKFKSVFITSNPNIKSLDDLKGKSVLQKDLINQFLIEFPNITLLLT